MKPKAIALATTVLIGAAAGAGAAQTALHNDPTVRQGFYAIGLADEVRRNCPQISPRLVRAYTFLKSLESYALKSGYSDADIDALKENDSEKDRLEAQIRSDLAKRGASAGNAAGFCKVGREEIARGTQAGRLLKVN